MRNADGNAQRLQDQIQHRGEFAPCAFVMVGIDVQTLEQAAFPKPTLTYSSASTLQFKGMSNDNICCSLSLESTSIQNPRRYSMWLVNEQFELNSTSKDNDVFFVVHVHHV